MHITATVHNIPTREHFPCYSLLFINSGYRKILFNIEYKIIIQELKLIQYSFSKRKILE